MLRFFRQIRKQLLNNNRFRKYLVYAIGEIVLVIIGILIALNLNNRSAEKKLEAKVELIFEDIMEELISDIDATFNIMEFYARRDSVMRLVLEDKITYDQYKENQTPHLYGLINFSSSANLTQNGYDNLVLNLDAVPPKLKPVIGDLNILYKTNKKWLQAAEDAIIDTQNKHSDFLKNNFSWYYQDLNSEGGWKNRVEYYLTYRYKNEVKNYYENGKNQLREAFKYRKKAIECYVKIAQLLDKPTTHESFIFDDEMAAILTGNWHLNSPEEPFHSYKLENGRLYYNFLSSSDSWEVVYLPRHNKLLHERGPTMYATIVEENGEPTVELSWGAELKKKD